MKNSMLSIVITGVFALSGCGGAGEEPYKELPKDDKQVTTADIDKASERQYLYIRSVGKAPRYAAAIKGFIQGDPKLVTLRKTENGIQIRQLDRDAIGLEHQIRYTDEYNKAPILTIPGAYIDYKCTEDKWRECINVEQENTDANLTWQDKKYFVPDFAQTKIAEMSINELTMFGACLTQTEAPRLVHSDEWKGYEMDLAKGVINFEIEHTYQASPSSCSHKSYKESLDNLSFTSTEYISIVALDELTSPDYQAIPYSERESSTYGFFKSSHSYRDVTDTAGVDGYVRSYLNRFNPAKSDITYYLSNNFYLPQNKPYLDAAKQTITALNIQNKLFNTGLPELKVEQANDKRHGDLRYSNITLFDEPLDNGLAGYGPSAANPMTGEIISARVNQYSSNLKQGSVRYYRQVRLDYNRGKLDEATATELTGVPYQMADHVIVPEPVVVSISGADAEFAKPTESLAVAARVLSFKPADNSLNALASFEQATQDFWSEETMMHVDSVFAEGGKDRELPRGIKDHRIDWTHQAMWVDGSVGDKLIAFEKMPLSLQNELTTKLAAQAFAGTLSHELGHNLGLRHNFAGSRDKDNTFTQVQLNQLSEAFTAAGYPSLNAKAEYASQMDYNVNRFSTLLQPYDLAALRFGYAREVELEQVGELDEVTAIKATAAAEGVDLVRNFVSLKTQDEKRRQELATGNIFGDYKFGALYKISNNNKLRNYDYCSDGHVDLNSNCNRSDAGENLDDIAQFYINRYYDSYETTNLRHNRQTLFEDDSLSYVIKRKHEFNDIRQFIEDLTGLEDSFDVAENSIASWCNTNSESWYCDSQRSVDHSADFFLKLMGENDAVVDVSFNWIKDSMIGPDQVKAGTTGLTKSYNFAKLLAKYRFKSADMDTKFNLGAVISQFSDSPEALKELIIKSGLNPDYQELLTPVVVFSGRLLNGIKAPASSPNHPYINERDVLGVWPDKLLAVRALVSRTTVRDSTGRSYRALVDLPKVAPVFKDMLCRMVMGFGPSLTRNDGTRVFPDECGYSNKLAQYLPHYIDFSTQHIEPLPNYDRTVSRYFGFDTVNDKPKGKSNLLEMVLRQVNLASVDSDYRGEQRARIWREYVGIHLDGPALHKLAEIAFNGRVYAATSENVLALALINRIKNMELFKVNNPNALLIVLGNISIGNMLERQLVRDRLALTYLPVMD